jgi:hypothetical protein
MFIDIRTSVTNYTHQSEYIQLASDFSILVNQDTKFLHSTVLQI